MVSLCPCDYLQDTYQSPNFNITTIKNPHSQATLVLVLTHSLAHFLFSDMKRSITAPSPVDPNQATASLGLSWENNVQAPPAQIGASRALNSMPFSVIVTVSPIYLLHCSVLNSSTPIPTPKSSLTKDATWKLGRAAGKQPLNPLL